MLTQWMCQTRLNQCFYKLGAKPMSYPRYGFQDEYERKKRNTFKKLFRKWRDLSAPKSKISHVSKSPGEGPLWNKSHMGISIDILDRRQLIWCQRWKLIGQRIWKINKNYLFFSFFHSSVTWWYWALNTFVPYPYSNALFTTQYTYVIMDQSTPVHYTYSYSYK